MAHRSPNCPQITFQDAAEKGRKVYTKERQHPAARAVVAEDLGYSGLNGRSLTLIGALRQYGILEGSGDALRVTDDAVAYFVRDEGAEKREAIKRMIYKPTLFAELNSQFGEALPSEGNLKHILVTKGFSEESAQDVIRVYKANSEFVSGQEAEYIGAVEDQQTMSTAAVSIPASIPSLAQRIPGAWTWPLSVPRGVNAQLVLTGEFTKADIGRLKKQIEFLEESFDDEAS
ncbi:hypothetical protein [Acidipila rosea]|uniref:Uncharacterized protein n=1 Tax=Acidipila rosea TaxID=768535 RepID=A0A4V2PVF9_9BACT|nr:hypothetical protein [Acidipila rosea]TCK73831.1 hypothetical protein C7378_1446 [Acidipila rosea]